MWYFSSPQIVFGEGSLSYLEGLVGQGAFIVTDPNLVRLGHAERVRRCLPAGMRVDIFDAVEPDPSFETVQHGAAALSSAGADWIIALGGGSVIDAAKAMWVLYERPELTPDAINPIETLGLRRKARLIAIPTTTGTGSEATWAIVLTDAAEKRKLGLGNRENLPDVALLDPELIAMLPQRLTADTALDALTHAIEGYTTTWHNDFSDGLCLQAARLIFEHLPRVHADPTDLEARTRLQNAATLAGMGFGNAMAGLAHGLGHALGAVFGVPHGRAVALFLPYTIEYACNSAGAPTRYGELVHAIGLPCEDERSAALMLARTVRSLEERVGQPLCLAACAIAPQNFEAGLERLVEHALMDTQSMMGTRVPESDDLRKLFRAAYSGEAVGF